MTDYPHTLYEWDFPPGGGNFRCRIIETEPGLVKAQQRKTDEPDSIPWDDVVSPMGWKNELVALAQECSEWRSDAAMAVMENCGDEIRGDEHHCTCVGPLRKLARDLGNDKVALTLTLNLETKLRKDTESARKQQVRSLQLQIGSLSNQLNEARSGSDRLRTDRDKLVEHAKVLKGQLDEARRELAEAEEAICLAAEELSLDGVVFSDERVSYEEIQVTRGSIKEFRDHPAVRRALERGKA